MIHVRCREIEKELRKALGFKITDFGVRLLTPGRKIYQVHGPNGYHWTGFACCRLAAMSEAYDAFERHLKLGDSDE